MLNEGKNINEPLTKSPEKKIESGRNLSRYLFYDFREYAEKEIVLHLRETRDGSAPLEKMGEVMKDVVEGLHKLAEDWNRKEDLKGIDIVVGVSYLVKRWPILFENLGFKISDLKFVDTSPVKMADGTITRMEKAMAYMRRDEFLSRYLR